MKKMPPSVSRAKFATAGRLCETVHLERGSVVDFFVMGFEMAILDVCLLFHTLHLFVNGGLLWSSRH